MKAKITKCAKCGGKTMKRGGTPPPAPGDRKAKKQIKKAENKNDKAKALGYDSWAAMEAAKGNKSQNAMTWTGVASGILGAAEGARRLFKKDEQKRGGTIKNKKVSSQPKKRK
jgi:hypothetical protein